MKDSECPFCGYHPYEYVDVGLGGRGVAVAVNCCEWGPLLFDWRTSKEDAEKGRAVADEILAGRLTREQASDELYRQFAEPDLQPDAAPSVRLPEEK